MFSVHEPREPTRRSPAVLSYEQPGMTGCEDPPPGDAEGGFRPADSGVDCGRTGGSMDKARHPHVVRTWTVERTRQRYQPPTQPRKSQSDPRQRNRPPAAPPPKPENPQP